MEYVRLAVARFLSHWYIRGIYYIHIVYVTEGVLTLVFKNRVFLQHFQEEKCKDFITRINFAIAILNA